jgi:hypothetical protein
MYNLLRKIQRSLGIFAFIIFVIPVSTNYKLINFGFGGGGTSNSTSTNYGLNAILGELNSIKLSGTNYKLGPGLIFSQQSHVPIAPTFENTGNWYNKLHFVINISNNPSDTLFALAISTDNFVSDTRYVQSDNTVGTTLGLEDYQTYTNWGGASGEFIIGLLSNTTYYIKAKAMQGKFTETDFGPVSSASTVSPSFDFDIDVSATDTETNPPFTITFSDLVADTVVDSPQKIWVDFATNGESGGYVYVYGQNSGLYSTIRSSTITSVTGDLSSLSQGVGGQSVSATQTSGGPLTALSPYNGAGQSVGIIDSTIRPIYSTTSPIVGGRASYVVKAKSSSITPTADDYTETLTVIASANF